MEKRLADYAGRTRLSEVDLRTLHLVLDELVSNVIRHGSWAEDSPRIWIRLEIVDVETLHVEVEDSGPPFDPCSAPTPDLDVPLEERSSGGMGLQLVRELTSGMSYRRSAGRNSVSFAVTLNES